MGLILVRLETGLRVFRPHVFEVYDLVFHTVNPFFFVLLYMLSSSCPVQAQGDPQITVMFTDIATGEQSGGKTAV